MKMTWFVLAVLVMAGLGYWNWQKGQEQLAALKQSGFQVSDDLKGNPRLVVSRSQQQLAIVTPHDYQRIEMADVSEAKFLFDRGVQIDENFRIELTLNRAGQSSHVIRYENETLGRDALDKLNQALGR